MREVWWWMSDPGGNSAWGVERRRDCHGLIVNLGRRSLVIGWT